MTAFDRYAHVYDLLYQDKDYEKEADHVATRIRQATGADGGRVLELGSGTGIHALALAQRGLEVVGIELSEAMTRRAEERLGREPGGPQVRFRQGDIRDVRLGRRFDAVVALFHVMSYQATDDDLLRALATAREHLSPGGFLLFDVWYGPAVLGQRPEVRVKRAGDEAMEVVRLAEPTLREEDLVDVRYTVFAREPGEACYESFSEVHTMRYHFLPQLSELLQRAGFEVLEAREWLTGEAPSEATWSLEVCARASS